MSGWKKAFFLLALISILAGISPYASVSLASTNFRDAGLTNIVTEPEIPEQTQITSSVPNKVKPDQSQWEITTTPYLWMSGSKTRTTIGDITAEADTSFTDALEVLKFGFTDRTEVWKNDWGFIVDAEYYNLGEDVSVDRRFLREIDSDLKQLLVDTELSRRFRVNLTQNKQKQLFIEPQIGIRNNYYKVSVDLTPGPQLRHEAHWIDPIIGTRFILPLNQKLKLFAEGTIGGFGIGEAAHFTWDVLAGLNYRVSKHTSLGGGYKIYDLNFSHGDTGLDVRNHGPWISLTWHF